MPATKKKTRPLFYALGPMGWGRGDTPEAAEEAYVRTQMRNFRASDTVFKTKAKFEAALRTGEVKADIWKAPEGTASFVIDHRGLNWLDEDDNYTDADISQKIRGKGVTE